MTMPPIIPTTRRPALAILLSLLGTVQAQQPPQPRLLPFQGRLTDANGAPVPDGARVVQFKIYDAPVGGQAKWVGEVHKLSVNRGLVNTILGSKASLAGVDFDHSVFLELTVDANGDDEIGLADPPLLPRQSILPAVFAKESADARKLDGFDWNDLFAEGATNPPAARIAGSRLVAESLTSAQIQARSIASDRLAQGAVTGVEIRTNTVDRQHLTAAVLESVIPPGVIVPFAGPLTNVPPGWLPCDGRLAKSSDYPALYAAVGTGWGDGSVGPGGVQENPPNSDTDFNLPDLRGVFLRGAAQTSPRDPDAASRTTSGAGGNTGQSADGVGSYQADELKAHNHPTTYTTSSGIPQNARPLAVHQGGNAELNDGFQRGDQFKGVGYGISQVAVGTGNIGGRETRPVNVAVNYIIKY